MPSDATNPRAGSQFEPLSFAPTGAPGSASCSKCGAALRGSYHMIGESMACAKCRYAAEATLQDGGDGSKVMRAIGYGLAVAALGALVDYVLAKMTGYDMPIFVILVAYVVGVAVRKASGGTGGRRFQVIAMVMAYIAMGAAYMPLMVTTAGKAAEVTRARVLAESKARVDSITAANPEGTELDSASAAALTRAQSTLRKVRDFKVPFSAAATLFLLALFGAPLLISLASPIYGLFVAFALYRAWKRNAGDGSSPEQVTVSGPFRLQQVPGSP
jgi:hypothetical protein